MGRRGLRTGQTARRRPDRRARVCGPSSSCGQGTWTVTTDKPRGDFMVQRTDKSDVRIPSREEHAQAYVRPSRCGDSCNFGIYHSRGAPRGTSRARRSAHESRPRRRRLHLIVGPRAHFGPCLASLPQGLMRPCLASSQGHAMADAVLKNRPRVDEHHGLDGSIEAERPAPATTSRRLRRRSRRLRQHRAT